MDILYVVALVMTGIVCTTSKPHHVADANDIRITSDDILRYIDAGDAITILDDDNENADDAKMMGKTTSNIQAAGDTKYNRIIIVPDEDELETSARENALEMRLNKEKEDEMMRREENDDDDISNDLSDSEEQTLEDVMVEEENGSPMEQGVWKWRGKKDSRRPVPMWRGKKDAQRDDGNFNADKLKRRTYFTRKMINWMNFDKSNLKPDGKPGKPSKRSMHRSSTRHQHKRSNNKKNSKRQFLSLRHHTMGDTGEMYAREQFLKLNPDGMGKK